MSTTAVHRPSAAFRVAGLAAVSILVIGLLPPGTAAANGGPPTTAIELGTALCVGGSTSTTVTLSGSVENDSGTVTLPTGCVAVLDLNSQQVKVRNVVLTAGSTLTIRDTSVSGNGKLIAIASGGSAGIRTTGATLVILGGEIEARGGGTGAGIGGSAGSLAGGTVTISGGKVVAVGGESGAGIGGGGGNVAEAGAGGTVTITGGDVTATGGARAAGIGGGGNTTAPSFTGGAGGTVSISGGVVLATGGTASEDAIGPGLNGAPIGSLSLGAGSVRVDSQEGGKPVTRITFQPVVDDRMPASTSFFAPGGVQPLQPAASAAFVRADGSPQQLAASAPGPNQVRYEADGVRLTFEGGAGTDASRGLVADPDGEVVCEICIANMAARQVIEVWMFSTPRLVAAHLTGDAECHLFKVPLSAPLDGGGPVSSGAHTLQITLATSGGLEAVNVGLTVGGLVPSSVPAGEGPGTPFAPILLGLAVLVAVRRIVAANA